MTFAARAGILTVSAALAVGAFAGTAAAANTVVQVDVSAALNARSVSTVANGVVTVWTPTQGVDNDGNGDGYVTNAVEAILKTQGKTENNAINKALPDDGMFPADPGGRYPAIALHFSNAAPITSLQTHQIHQGKGPQSFSFDVPNATYSKMFLIVTSSEGTGNLTVTLTYAGGVAPTVLMLKLPDYGIGGAAAGDPVFFNLIDKMHKWSGTDNETDVDSHTITGIEINPTPTATLTSIEIAKTNGSYIDFWGATGIATSAVTTGSGGSGGSGGSTDAGAGGSTDASTADGGAGGVGGVGGEAGASGTTGAAGAATSGNAGSGAGEAGSTGTGGSTSGAAGASGPAGTTGTSGAAGSTPGARSSSGGGCSLAGTPSRDGAALLLALIACALPFRRRRRR